MARARRLKATNVDFTDESQTLRWLKGQPREAIQALAARAALRSLPLLPILDDDTGFNSNKVLITFRALFVTWAAISFLEPVRKNLVERENLAESAKWIGIEILEPVRAALFSAGFHALDLAANAAAEACSMALHSACSAAVRADAMQIDSGANLDERAKTGIALAHSPLWHADMPAEMSGAWSEFKKNLLAGDDAWQVWVNWYEDRLAGRQSFGEAFDLAVATLPDELWEKGAEAVSARIKELIAEHTPPEPIPAQGAGPQFGLNPDLKITLAPPGEFDSDGNNLSRMRQQLPLVRQAGSDLAGVLNPNSHPVLCRNLTDYLNAIAGEPETISWGTVFGLGVRLDNAAAAARREIADRMRDPLEDAAQEALDSMLMLHGPLILATAEGRELADEADRYRLTRDQQAALREDAQAIAQGLKNSPDIIERPAAELGEMAAESIGEGDHPERGTAFGLATVNNVTTVLVSAGTLAAFVPASAAAAGSVGAAAAAGVAWVGYEGLKKSQRFTAATSALGVGFDHLHNLGEVQVFRRLIALAPFRRFVRANEAPLRRIAQNSTQLRWMLPYIDFIVRTNPNQE